MTTPESKTVELISRNISVFKKENRRIFATSSFQTQSLPLLHIIGKYFPEISILLLDTGFLFPETYSFLALLKNKLQLNIITLKSATSLHEQRDKETGLFQFASDPDYCCYINKVKPLHSFLHAGDVWISGVRRDQTSVRKEMNEMEIDKNGIIRFHPMLDWTSKDIHDYIQEYQLPKHPLEADGYVSIGCVPCTYKWADGEERGGRWVGSKKTECGLHTKQ